MGNDAFLIASYFAGGLICVCLGLAAYAWLRRPVVQIADALPQRSWGGVLKRSLPASMILFALSAFLSVKYDSCGTRSYKDILSDHSYMITKNQEQISETFSSITVAVFLWGAIILFALLAIRRAQAATKSRGEGKDSFATDPTSGIP
jgi:hypothetical protein